MSCSCHEVETFIAIHIYLKPDSPFPFCDLSVYMPVQLRASPPHPSTISPSLLPPPPRAHTHLKESVGKDRFGKISPAGVIQANLRDLFLLLYLGNIRETSSSHVPQFKVCLFKGLFYRDEFFQKCRGEFIVNR